jgi:hypothetical protein
MCSVLFCVWDLKRWIDGWSNLKGAVDATMKGPESRSANLWITIRTWICALCVCVFGDLKSSCKDRIEREASQAYPKRASLLLPCVALRTAPLCSALLLPAIVKSSAPSGTFRSTFLYSLYATSARNRKLLLSSSRTGYYSKNPLRD